MQGLNQNRIDKMVVVTDDWYPCFDGNKVKVSLFISNLDKLNCHFVRICAWGNDDFGVEMDYEDDNYNNLVIKYNEWKENIFDKIEDGISLQWFLDKGFYNA